MQAFADIVRAGKALYIGVSEWTVDEIRAGAALARDLGIHLISNQPQYSLLWRVIEKEVVPACEELGLGQICWSPMAQGVLTGKYVPGQAAPAASRFTGEDGKLKSDNRYLTEDILTRVQQLKPLAADAGLSMPALAVAWVLQNPNVSAAIVGASRPDQLIDTATAAGVKLDPALLARVDDIMDPVVERDPAKVESFTTRP
jgi:aryl-alcohol dehydrogenase-like predicted oxidoreductase